MEGKKVKKALRVRKTSPLKKEKPFQFNGWTWAELGEAWGLQETKGVEFADVIRNRIYSVDTMSWGSKPKATREYKDCRRFLRALIKAESGYLVPFYDGILKVESPFEFMRLMAINLEIMWT